MHGSSPNEAGCDPADAPGGRPSRQASLVERLSRYGMQVMPGAFQRRSRLQRRQDASGSCAHQEAPDRGSLTPSDRKRHLRELLRNPTTHVGVSSASSAEQDVNWVLYPMEHAWMLSAVEGSYETLLEFISGDPSLLTRKDFISGYSVLHWLAKRGQDDTLLKLLSHARTAGVPVNVNLRGSGGLTPLHVASIHSRYPVIKLLVGAFGANVDAMDYNGRRAWQYLGENAPQEMKELLGTWDDEHSCGSPQNANCNCNSAPAVNAPEEEEEQTEEGNFKRTMRAGHWRFGSLRRLLPSFSILANKS